MQRKDIVFEYNKRVVGEWEVYSLYVEGEPRHASFMKSPHKDFEEQIKAIHYAAQVLGYNVIEFKEIEV